MSEAEYNNFKAAVFKEYSMHHEVAYNFKKHKESFAIPCKLCGKTDHPMLHPSLTEDGSVKFYYSCPVAEYDDWRKACEAEDQLAKYNICPYKFAKVCDYNYNKVHEALDYIRTCKSSKYQDTHTIRMFRRKVLQICSQNQPEDQPMLKYTIETGIVIIASIFAILIGISMTRQESQL